MLFRGVKRPDPEREENLRRQIAEAGGVGKTDIAAMLISAAGVLLLPAVAVLLLILTALCLLL